MSDTRATRIWTIVGTGILALTLGVMVKTTGPAKPSEDLRDAVASVPMSPAIMGAARVAQPSSASYFASPATRRAEAEKALMSSRMTKVSRAMSRRAAELRRQAARERAMATTAQ
ncbi:MAG: hypothetical protein M0D55_19460 [Elusimicrobiota bacterium]|nr:MAG: hypothetical protein M0D55_19460 [Elusimicrobiota bacterium]